MKSTIESKLIHHAIKDAIIKALKAKPVKFIAGTEDSSVFQCYEIDGDVWTEEAAVEHILGKYSWWNEGK